MEVQNRFNELQAKIDKEQNAADRMYNHIIDSHKEDADRMYYHIIDSHKEDEEKHISKKEKKIHRVPWENNAIIAKQQTVKVAEEKGS